MGHSYNHGLVTSMKGATIEAVRITGLDSTNCTIAEQSAAGFVESVTCTAGVVTIQLAGPYPPRMVTCIPAFTADSATEDIITARYAKDGYDPTNGTITIYLSNDDDSGAPAAGAAVDSLDELHVMMIFCRYTVLSK